MAQLIIDGCRQCNVAEEIEELTNIPRDKFRIKRVPSEKTSGDSFDVVTGHRSIIEQIYEARANFPRWWSIPDAPGPIDPFVVKLTYSSCAVTKIPADGIHEILLNAIENDSHQVSK